MFFNKHYKIDLKQRRKDMNLTQTELAKKCGISKSTVQSLESRSRNATIKHLIAYAKGINVNPLDIIDVEHYFKHYEDMKDYALEGIDSIHEIVNLCIRLATDRITKVHKFAKKMLDEQEHLTVNFKNLSEEIKHYDLEIQLLINEDSTVYEIPEVDRKRKPFDGKIPKDYTICAKLTTSGIPPYEYGQIVFLKAATIDGMFSGVNVVIKNKNGNLYIRKYRCYNNKSYLIPLTSDSAHKSEGELDKADEKYRWKENDDWEEVEYLINQPSF